MSRKRWVQKPLPNGADINQLSESLNDLPLPLARALILRGITDFDGARAFFRDTLETTPDPFLMADMEVAVDRIIRAIEEGERMIVYGDYDVDGTSATALLTHFLKRSGADAEYFVPHRFEHGYGLSREGLDHVKSLGASLVLSVDCGITAVDEAEYASELGMDLIVCDHHTPPDQLPNAVAILDPKRDDCSYPFQELCGCGVAFKLALAVHMRRGGEPDEMNDYLDLVAVATTSDLVSLTAENRVLVREGMRLLQSQARMGFKALAEEAGVKLSTCSAASLVYTLSPRINAAGRLGDASRAVSLLLADDELEAVARARQLERLNKERRQLDRETQEEAVKKANTHLAGEPRNAIVLHDEDWHLGVIGIVASRLVDMFYRPTILLTSVDGVSKGSARSIEGINIYEAIKSCEDLLIEFGGHDYAAGVTLKTENIPAFRERLEDAVSAEITTEMLEPVVEYDATMSMGDLDKRFWSVLKQFAPFGFDNPSPVFHATDLKVVGPVATVGKERNHLKFAVTDLRGSSRSRNVIGFRMGKYLDLVSKSQTDDLPIEMLFSIQENTWNGRTTLQLKAEDIRARADFP